jgi:hypothetical protein
MDTTTTRRFGIAKNSSTTFTRRWAAELVWMVRNGYPVSAAMRKTPTMRRVFAIANAAR